jgi:CheY-like chemotaxis protein
LNCAWPIGNPQHGCPTILVAEDEILVRMMVTEALRQQGFNVAEAANAEEALSIIHSGIPIHLVLTDIRMPGTKDGADLAAAVRAEFPDVKVVIASSNPPENQLRQTVDGFFQKPYDISGLIGFIKALLDR